MSLHADRKALTLQVDLSIVNRAPTLCHRKAEAVPMPTAPGPDKASAQDCFFTFRRPLNTFTPLIDVYVGLSLVIVYQETRVSIVSSRLSLS